MRCVLLLLLALTLAACQSVNSDVTVFHNLPDSGPRTFSLAPAEGQSLETASYLNLVADELTQRGWTHKQTGGDLLVRIGYGVDNGQTVTSSIPLFGQTGGETSFTNGTISGSNGLATYTGTTYTPATYGVVGDIPVSTTFYNRTLTVNYGRVYVGQTNFRGNRPK
jgi:hypothetical protein